MYLAKLLIFLALGIPQQPHTHLALDIAQQPDTLDAARLSSARSSSAPATGPVRSVEAEALERMGAAGLGEVLRTFAGVSIKDYGGIGGLKTVQVRSLGAQHTAICYDGAFVSDACNGQPDLSRFGLDGLGEIKMEIGTSDDIFAPARTLGSAGTLSLKSAEPLFLNGKASASARMRYASFNTLNPYVAIARKLGSDWVAKLEGDWLQSEGAYPFTLKNGSELSRELRLGSDVHRLNADAHAYGKLAGGRLSAKAGYSYSERGLPGAVIYYSQNPTERLWDRNADANLIWERSWDNGWRVKAGGSFASMGNRYLDSSASYAEPQEDNYLQREYAASAVAGKDCGSGLGYSLAQDLFANTLQSDIPGCSFPTRISSYTVLRGRYSHNRLSLTACIGAVAVHESVRNGEPAPDRLRISPAIAASWLLTDGLRIRASVRDGFRLPSFNDLYYPRVGTANLQPEKALQTGLGLSWSSPIPAGHITLTADGYWNRVKDKIVAVPTMFIWKMRNVGLVQMLGSDISASAIWAPGRLLVHLDAAYSYQYAVDVSDPSAKNYRHQIQYTPRHSGSISAGLDTPWVNIGYTLSAAGVRYFHQQNLPAYALPAYADHSIALRRSFDIRGIGLLAGAELLNLTDNNYEIVRAYPMPGRSFRLSIKLTY